MGRIKSEFTVFYWNKAQNGIVGRCQPGLDTDSSLSLQSFQQNNETRQNYEKKTGPG